MGIRIASDNGLWRGNRLPFVINRAALDAADAAAGVAVGTGVANANVAINDWNAATPFLQLTARDGEMNFVEFMPTPDSAPCGSPIGMRGGRQQIQCGAGPILHEIGHAAGLWHEQSRQDRDSFVTINADNVNPIRLHNFEIHDDDGTDLGEYDYASLMHYGRMTFAKAAGLITIVAPAGMTIGAATTLSSDDLNALQLMYEARVGWTLMRGKLMHVSTGTTNVQWGVNSDNDIFVRDGNVWNQISGKLNQISVAADGTVWGVNSSNDIFRRDGNSWTQISGELKYVSVGSSTLVWGVNSDNDIFRRDGNSWTQISGKLKQISVASDGTIWGVNASNNIFRRDGNSWTQISGSLKHVSVGSATEIWGVNSGDEIFFRDVRNNQWEIVSGQLDQISVAADGSIWGVNSNDDIFRR
jgi:hypothetical protein